MLIILIAMTLFETGGWSSPSTTPVGFYNGQNYEGFQTTDSPSPYGAYDMSGNVEEWTSTPYLVDNPEYIAYKLKGGSYQHEVSSSANSTVWCHWECSQMKLTILSQDWAFV